MMIRVHPANGRRTSRWKNGKGTTQEVAVYPPGGDLDNFAWRVSIAEISEDGIFSVFHGVDRKLAILDGRLILSIGGEPGIALSHESEPVAFPGDIPCKVEIAGPPARDLNVMTRRDRFSSRLTMVEIGGPITIAVEADKTLIVARHTLILETGQSLVHLGPMDAASFENGPDRQGRFGCNIRSTLEAARFYVIDLFAEHSS